MMYWKNIYPPTRTTSLTLLFYLNFANYLVVRSPDLAVLLSPSGPCVLTCNTKFHGILFLWIGYFRVLCDHNKLSYLLRINFGDWRKVQDRSLKIFCFTEYMQREYIFSNNSTVCVPLVKLVKQITFPCHSIAITSALNDCSKGSWKEQTRNDLENKTTL